RPAWADIDETALAANAAALAALVAPSRLCAVVKADGYGHGAITAARAALSGGATWLGVALVEEGLELRDAGIDASVLVLSEPPPAAIPEALAHRLTLTVYSPRTIAAVGAEARRTLAPAGGGAPAEARSVPVHLKMDTGMHRVGADATDAVALAEQIAAEPDLRFEGLYTHLAVADEADGSYTVEQLARFEKVRGELSAHGLIPEMVHAANSGGAIFHPAARLDMVRCGISLYGYPPAPSPPAPALPSDLNLTPALSLKAQVTFVRRLAQGERLSYGLRYTLARDSVIATVPLGYADGVVRELSHRGGQVIVGGRRVPMAGTTTMDQLMIDCGPDANVSVGDEVVLIGAQGDEAITAEEWAARLDTISYEILCGVGPRVDRRPLRGKPPAPTSC
ncbi:MAG TPA: alanine racemase, partial [Acidimicrobiales bacterium]|nr:alanine racemase [Acidimicrobiales bacterium]